MAPKILPGPGNNAAGVLAALLPGSKLFTDLATARQIYGSMHLKAKNGKISVVLTRLQEAKLIFEQHTQTLFNKDLFKTIY